MNNVMQMLCFVACGSFVLSLPRFFEYYLEVSYSSNTTNVAIRTRENFSWTKVPAYLIGYRIVLSFLLIYLIPMSTLVGLNTRILVALWRSAKLPSPTIRSFSHHVCSNSCCTSSFPSNHSCKFFASSGLRDAPTILSSNCTDKQIQDGSIIITSGRSANSCIPSSSSSSRTHLVRWKFIVTATAHSVV
jgi:hypothetical protein